MLSLKGSRSVFSSSPNRTSEAQSIPILKVSQKLRSNSLIHPDNQLNLLAVGKGIELHTNTDNDRI